MSIGNPGYLAIKIFIFRAIMLSLLSLILIHSSAWAQQASYADGVRAYSQGHYPQAIALLKACADGPQGKSGSQADLIHYYLGMAYQAANQRGLANAEYTWVYTNSRNATLKANATVGSQRLSRSSALPVSAGSSATGGTVASASVALLPRGGLCSRDPSSYFANGRDYPGGRLDCGPTCMIMIFKAFNKFPSNFPTDPAKMVGAARLLMTGKDDQDYTTIDQILAAAHKTGYRTDRFDGMERLNYWLKQGVPVIALGAPTGPGCYGLRAGFPADQAKDVGHYVVVTGTQGSSYQINDIYQPAPIEMTNAEMTAYINGSGFNGRYQQRCVALSP